MKRLMVPWLFLVALLAGGNVHAQSPVWRLGGRVQYISGSATSGPVGTTGFRLDLDSGPGIEFDASVMISERFGGEFSVGATSDRLSAIGVGCCGVDGGRVWLFPITAMAQYHQPIYGNWDPYVGLGVSWILPVYSISGDLEDSGLERLEFDGDVGIALQIGANYQLDNRWYANLDLRWTRASLEARTRISGIDSPPVTLDVDPFTISLGFGYRF